MPAKRLRRDGVAGDHVVCLDAFFLYHRKGKGTRRIAYQRKLRSQILWRWWAVGFVLVVNIIAETGARLVQNNCQMSWSVRGMQIIGQFPKHVRIARNSPDGHTLRIGEGRQTVIGAKDVGRAIDEVKMLLVGHPIRIALASGCVLRKSCSR